MLPWHVHICSVSLLWLLVTLLALLTQNLLMRDDTLLEHVEFAEPQLADNLTPLQQAVLIGHWWAQGYLVVTFTFIILCSCSMYMQRCSPAHRLNLEECEAYINVSCS